MFRNIQQPISANTNNINPKVNKNDVIGALFIKFKFNYWYFRIYMYLINTRTHKIIKNIINFI